MFQKDCKSCRHFDEMGVKCNCLKPAWAMGSNSVRYIKRPDQRKCECWENKPVSLKFTRSETGLIAQSERKDWKIELSEIDDFQYSISVEADDNKKIIYLTKDSWPDMKKAGEKMGAFLLGEMGRL